MSFIELANKRYSVRDYKAEPVEKEKILKVLEAARIAPSAANYQPYHFIVLTEENERNKVTQAYSRDWIKKAPVIIAACGDHSTSWKRRDGKDYCDIDVAIALDHMTLAAADLQLGTCWIGAFDAEKLHPVLGLPDNLELIALMLLGYPATEPTGQQKKRRTLDDMVSWERYM